MKPMKMTLFLSMDMSKFKINMAFTICTLFLAEVVHASTFCVTTPLELYFALNDTATNGESDMIKIAEGIYSINSFSLVYNGSNDLNLEISGGWINLENDLCGQ